MFVFSSVTPPFFSFLPLSPTATWLFQLLLSQQIRHFTLTDNIRYLKVLLFMKSVSLQLKPTQSWFQNWTVYKCLSSRWLMGVRGDLCHDGNSRNRMRPAFAFSRGWRRAKTRSISGQIDKLCCVAEGHRWCSLGEPNQTYSAWCSVCLHS